jgi:hypothetical protein
MANWAKWLFKEIRPNLVYDIAKYLLFGGVALIIAAFAFLYRYTRGYPRDLLLIALIFVAAFVLMALAGAITVYLRRKERGTSHTNDRIDLLPTSQADIKGLDYAAQIKTVTDERDRQAEVAIRFQNEAIELRRTIEEHGCSEGWLHQTAKAQALNIRDSIEVLSVGVWAFELDTALPTIKCGVLFKNNSLFPLSIAEEISGDLFFNRHRLAERKFTRRISGEWPQRSEGEIFFDQRLSKPEAEVIINETQGRFSFASLSFTVSSPDGKVKAQQIHVPESFKPRLDEQITASALEVRQSDSQREFVLGIPRGQLVISKAEYGAGNVWKDVADIMRSRIYANESRLRLSDSYSDMFGDPLPQVPKILRVIYVYNGARFSVELPENAKITLPFPYTI